LFQNNTTLLKEKYTMIVLVIGSGGREHAICRALAQSPKVTALHCAPGNGGIADIAACHNVKATDIPNLIALAKTIAADYVFVASDDPLVAGAVDELNAAGFRTFGPKKSAAAIEGSKVFAKSFMKRHGIPTAAYEAFESPAAALEYLREIHYPAVIKSDGLALGKGAVIVEDFKQAQRTIDEIMVGKKFGDSGNSVVVEAYMRGVEVTVLAFTDGYSVVTMPPATDHKRAFDGDLGLNTGGMGVIAPTPYFSDAHMRYAMRKIIKPTILELRNEGRNFSGCIYFELMVTDNPEETKVIEYNCRFGDPEAQALLPLLKTDLMDIVEAVWEQKLAELDVVFANQACACVVAASGGYPEKYDTGFEITGLDQVDGVSVYHAGTKKTDGRLVTSGGRVLNVSAVADTLPEALDKAYHEIKKIHFSGMFYRRDIGRRALECSWAKK
jgi:phosphoribosylamine--glycine ligase